MKRVFVSILLLLLIAPWAGAQPGAASDGLLKVLFTGRRQGRLDSCGCFKGQQGGVQYEALIDAASSATLRIDAGDWTVAGIQAIPHELLQTRFLLRGLELLGMDAVNVGRNDMELTESYLAEIARRQNPVQAPPLISANIYLKSRPEQRAFPAWRMIRKTTAAGECLSVGITGVTIPRTGRATPDSISYFLKPPLECLRPVLAELRTQVDLLVVLVSGDAPAAAEISRSCPQIDLIIVTGDGAPGPEVAPRAAGVPVVMIPGALGKDVGSLGLRRAGKGPWAIAEGPVMLPVNRDKPPRPEMAALIEEFKKETRQLEVRLPAPDVKKIYGGAQRCQACHKDEYAQWSRTPHAGALQTLMDRGQEYNPACLKCHTTGFRESNGFYSVTHVPSRMLTGVQCEACHGAGLAHAEAQMKQRFGMQSRAESVPHPRKAPGEAVCLGCHTPENDAHFVYNQKLPKVTHAMTKGLGGK